MKRSRKYIAIVAAVLLAVHGTAFAATDGSVGDTSTGTANVTLTTNNLIELTGMADLSKTQTDNTALDVNENVRVYSNIGAPAAGQYKVLGHGNYTAGGAAGRTYFLKRDGSNDTIAYTVSWHDTTGTAGNNLLLAAAADDTTFEATVQQNATNNYAAGADNANYQVEAAASDILDKPAGVYRGVITIIVTPND